MIQVGTSCKTALRKLVISLAHDMNPSGANGDQPDSNTPPFKELLEKRLIVVGKSNLLQRILEKVALNYSSNLQDRVKHYYSLGLGKFRILPWRVYSRIWTDARYILEWDCATSEERLKSLEESGFGVLLPPSGVKWNLDDHFARYSVIHLSFSDPVWTISFERVLFDFRQQILESISSIRGFLEYIHRKAAEEWERQYKLHQFGDLMNNQNDARTIDQFMRGPADEDLRCRVARLKSCLPTLVELLWRAFGRKVVILIDDFDRPLTRAVSDYVSVTLILKLRLMY